AAPAAMGFGLVACKTAADLQPFGAFARQPQADAIVDLEVVGEHQRAGAVDGVGEADGVAEHALRRAAPGLSRGEEPWNIASGSAFPCVGHDLFGRAAQPKMNKLTARSGVWVVIAAYNEARAVGQVVAGLIDAYRVVVVDDGSTDGTAEISGRAG